VDGIVMSTRGHAGLARAILGSTATATLERATMPLIVLGPHALRAATTAQIHIRAPVRTLDDELVGEVHRVVIDLEQRAIVSVVVLGRGPLARDVLVPVDVIEALDEDQLILRLTRDELDELPGFTYTEYVTPPPTWTSLVPRIIRPAWLAVSERKRLGAHQQDITPGSRVLGVDGDLGPVDRVEVDRTGQIEAFWVRGDGLFATDMRIPIEWIQQTDVQGNLRIDATKADIETHLGHESRVRLGPPPLHEHCRCHLGLSKVMFSTERLKPSSQRHVECPITMLFRTCRVRAQPLARQRDHDDESPDRFVGIEFKIRHLGVSARMGRDALYL
jgi:PRC-barrel domain